MTKIEKDIDRIQRIVDDAAKALDRKISALLVDSSEAAGDRMALARALSMRAEIGRAFEGFTQTTGEALKLYQDAAKESVAALVEQGIDVSYLQSDLQLVNAMIATKRSEIAGLSMATQSKVHEAIYMGAVVGQSKTDLLGTIEQLVIGQTDARGNPMRNYVATIARTGYMEVDAVVQRTKAQEAGIEKFKYVGSTVRDSRKWCVQHVGKVFTLKEIQEWESQNWAGKKAGDPFVVRGGWNCMHHFRAIIEK